VEEGLNGRDFGLRLVGWLGQWFRVDWGVGDLGGIYSWRDTCDVQQKFLGSNSP
jgi:hypothetical protein